MKKTAAERQRALRAERKRQGLVQVGTYIRDSDRDRLRAQGRSIGLGLTQYVARLLDNAANRPPCPEADPELYEVYLRAVQPMGMGITPGSDEAIAIVDEFDAKLERLKQAKYAAALDALLLEVHALRDGLLSRRIARDAAGETILNALRDYTEVTGWDATEARQRQR